MLSEARVSIGKIWKWNAALLLGEQQEGWALLRKNNRGNPADLLFILLWNDMQLSTAQNVNAKIYSSETWGNIRVHTI